MESAFLQDRGGNKSILSCLDCGGSNPPISSHGNHVARDEMKQTEEFLASEMNKLSVQERSEALDDVHCVGEELKETNEMIEESLMKFEEDIQQANDPIYEMACQQNRAYVENRAFRLKFLRANLHNIGRSVRQMLTFLKCKGMYFGDDKLACDITLEDLNEEDKNLMVSGLFHIQESRDPRGRVIVWVFNNMLGQCRAETLNRVSYYIFYNIVCNISEVQYKGVVTCYYDLVKPGEAIAMPGLNRMIKILEFITSIPMRFSAMHHCLKTGKGNLALNNALIGMSMNIFPKAARVRARLHYGSDMELCYQLRSHGFSIDTCPVDTSGNIRLDIINKWFYDHKMMTEGTAPECLGDQSDRSSSEAETVGSAVASAPKAEPMKVVSKPSGHNRTSSPGPTPVVPSRHDVLLGRGRTIQSHQGNVFFRDFVKQYRDDYDRAPRNKRRKITTDLVYALKAKGIRFLQQTDNGDWIESSFAEAEKKIGQVFRNTRRR